MNKNNVVKKELIECSFLCSTACICFGHGITSILHVFDLLEMVAVCFLPFPTAIASKYKLKKYCMAV